MVKISQLSVYVWILVGFSIGLYAVGYTSPFISLVTSVGASNFSWSLLINKLLGIFTNPIFLATLGGAAVTSLIYKSSNFLSTFIIPIMIVVVLMNIFVIPNSFLFDASLPVFARTLLSLFLNVSMVLATIDFVRGAQ